MLQYKRKSAAATAVSKPRPLLQRREYIIDDDHTKGATQTIEMEIEEDFKSDELRPRTVRNTMIASPRDTIKFFSDVTLKSTLGPKETVQASLARHEKRVNAKNRKIEKLLKANLLGECKGTDDSKLKEALFEPTSDQLIEQMKNMDHK